MNSFWEKNTVFEIFDFCFRNNYRLEILSDTEYRLVKEAVKDGNDNR